MLRKLKNIAPYSVRKQLVESLMLSKLNYNDAIFTPLPVYLIKRLQRVQLAAAGFVLGRYANEKDLLKLKWLPISERRDHRLACLAHRALYSTDWSLSAAEAVPPSPDTEIVRRSTTDSS